MDGSGFATNVTWGSAGGEIRPHPPPRSIMYEILYAMLHANHIHSTEYAVSKWHRSKESCASATSGKTFQAVPDT